MNLPNTVIIGPPKCGTTSLFRWLNDHPDVFGRRETHYFTDAGNPINRQYKKVYWKDGVDGYLEYFKDCPQGVKLILESTPNYLYQETALQFFSNCKPQPNIIISLRKPSKQIFSAFSYAQNNLSVAPKNISFSYFVDLLLSGEIDKIEKDFYPFEGSFYYLSKLLDFNTYYKWLLLWKERFPRENLHLLIFEEVVSNPQETVSGLAKSLGIDPYYYKDYDFSNKNKTVGKEIKNWFLHKQLIFLSRLIPRKAFRGKIKRLYLKLSQRETVIPKADPITLEALDNYFLEKNKKLEEIFNLDLSIWD